jgi:uncharacterized damage-inducible protein DinB
MTDDALRDHVASLLHWQDAHAGFDTVVEGVPADMWGAAAEGLPYTLWQLLEHLRLAQSDILEFCRNPHYTQPRWPEDYWPTGSTRPTADAVAQSLAGFREDLQALTDLALDRKVDLFARIPHGTGQTFLRELLLVADHNSYHVGQMVTVRRALGIWQ